MVGPDGSNDSAIAISRDERLFIRTIEIQLDLHGFAAVILR